VTKNDVQNVHRQPAHKLMRNDDATDESLLWRHNDVVIGHSIVNCKQEKYLPTCMFGPLRWSMPKSTKPDAKLSEIYEQNDWYLFSV